MIDLHIHSNHSDGSSTVTEILKEAEKRSLEIISITDHDSIKAYEELKRIDVKQYYSGKIINGCEMKCVYKNTPVEILGYNVNIEKFKNSKNLGSLKEKYLDTQKEYLDHLKKVGKEIGLKFNKNLDINIEKMQYASDIFQKEILKYPENSGILKKNKIKLEPNFYRAQQCNPNSIFYINETIRFPTMQEMIQEIQKAEGFAFLAHPYIYPFESTIEVVEEMIKTHNLDGIECYYSYFNNNQIQSLTQLCNKYHLYKSGGTDFHGKNRPDTRNGSWNRKFKDRKNNHRKLDETLQEYNLRSKKNVKYRSSKSEKQYHRKRR